MRTVVDDSPWPLAVLPQAVSTPRVGIRLGAVSREERRDHRGHEGDIEHCEQDYQDCARDS